MNPTESARVGSRGKAELGRSASFYENANQKQLKPTQLQYGRNLPSVYTKMKENIDDLCTKATIARPCNDDEQVTTLLFAIFLLNS